MSNTHNGTPTLSGSGVISRTISSVTFEIPTAKSKLLPFQKELTAAVHAIKQQQNAGTQKNLKEAGERYQQVREKLKVEVPEEICDVLWDEYHACRNKTDKRLLKAEYNELATDMNKHCGRKIYLLL